MCAKDVPLNEKNLICKLQYKYLGIKHQHRYKYFGFTEVQRPMTTSLVHICRSANENVCTHVQSVSAADVVPTLELGIPSIQSESDATTNTPMTAE